uniref:Uncharacterized protein n=1 Tax=Lygus hesperus TaxID=30085 RepID=A0A0A9YJU6_LYGHE
MSRHTDADCQGGEPTRPPNILRTPVNATSRSKVFTNKLAGVRGDDVGKLNYKSDLDAVTQEAIHGETQTPRQNSNPPTISDSDRDAANTNTNSNTDNDDYRNRSNLTMDDAKYKNSVDSSVDDFSKRREGSNSNEPARRGSAAVDRVRNLSPRMQCDTGYVEHNLPKTPNPASQSQFAVQRTGKVAVLPNINPAEVLKSLKSVPSAPARGAAPAQVKAAAVQPTAPAAKVSKPRAVRSFLSRLFHHKASDGKGRALAKDEAVKEAPPLTGSSASNLPTRTGGGRVSILSEKFAGIPGVQAAGKIVPGGPTSTLSRRGVAPNAASELKITAKSPAKLSISSHYSSERDNQGAGSNALSKEEIAQFTPKVSAPNEDGSFQHFKRPAAKKPP